MTVSGLVMPPVQNSSQSLSMSLRSLPVPIYPIGMQLGKGRLVHAMVGDVPDSPSMSTETLRLESRRARPISSPMARQE